MLDFIRDTWIEFEDPLVLFMRVGQNSIASG